MDDLPRLPNIGPKLVGWLIEAGIDSAEALRATGPVAAYVRLKYLRPGSVSLNALWALYGAIHGMPWNRIDPAVKQGLLDSLPHAPGGIRGRSRP